MIYFKWSKHIPSDKKNKKTARQKTIINLFLNAFKEFKGDIKDFFQPGFHRGGHGRQSGGEARGEHADQRVTTVMMIDMMVMTDMMMMMVVMTDMMVMMVVMVVMMMVVMVVMVMMVKIFNR